MKADQATVSYVAAAKRHVDPSLTPEASEAQAREYLSHLAPWYLADLARQAMSAERGR